VIGCGELLASVSVLSTPYEKEVAKSQTARRNTMPKWSYTRGKPSNSQSSDQEVSPKNQQKAHKSERPT